MANAIKERLQHQVLNGKVCNDCKTVKPIDNFSKVNSSGNVYRTYCKPCAVIRTQKRHAEPNFWLKFRLRKFGMELKDYEAMLEKQQYRCAICFSQFDPDVRAKIPNLDHNHKNGQVRALLCFNCNTVLGKVYDDPSILDSMVNYLKKHNKENKDNE